MTSTISPTPVAASAPVLTPPPPDASRPAARRGITLTVVYTVTAMLMLDIAVVNTALPSLARSLGAGRSGIQWVVDAYTVALAATVLTAGALADRFGRRRALLAGLALFTVASAICGAAGSIALLDAARAVQGVGGAILFACSLAVLDDAFPATADRAKALAGYGAVIGGSFAVGPFLGGVLTESADWRWIFLVNVPVGIVCFALTARGVRESRDPAPRRVDVPGVVLLSAALGALVYGLIRAGVDGWSDGTTVAMLLAGGVLLAVFLVVEARTAEPMLPLGLFRDRVVTGAQIAAVGISASLFAIFLYTTLYLQGVLHLSPVEAGAVYLPGTVVMFVAAGVTASLQQRLAPATALVASLVAVSGGLVLLTLAGTDSSWVAVLPGSMLAFIGAGVCNPVMSGLVLQSAPAGQAGLATGVNDAFRQTGIALGVAVLGVLIPAGDAAGFTRGLHHAELVAAGIALAGAIGTAGVLRRR
ncbi:MAG: MFS transporter [Jatrophihabitans sp.]|uniref:MFS transporter n=1 Tax=Jatrophihabitans sp. TaxID=1932789 RepID=UPI003F803EE7